MTRKEDIEKARFWQNAIRQAARSGMSIREFCRQQGLTVSQFYYWQHRLRRGQPWPSTGRRNSQMSAASFALVSTDGQGTEVGIELLLSDGRRLRIHKGVDEETLRQVLAAMEG